MKFNIDPPDIDWSAIRVYGIVTALPGYSLASKLDKEWGVRFERCENDHQVSTKEHPHWLYYPMFMSHEVSENGPMACLISARCESPLLIELKQFDFFLVVYHENWLTKHDISMLKKIREIQFLQEVQLSQIKQKELLPIY